MTTRQNNRALGPVGNQLSCMTEGCDNHAKVWVTKFSAEAHDVNGISRDEGMRNKHVCGRCADEMKALFGWERLASW